MDICISYSSGNKDLRDRIVRLLGSTDWTVYYDERNFEIGPRWRPQWQRWMRDLQSPTVVVLLTPESNRSPYVAEEVVYARKHQRRVVFILFEDMLRAEEVRPEWQAFNFGKVRSSDFDADLDSRDRILGAVGGLGDPSRMKALSSSTLEWAQGQVPEGDDYWTGVVARIFSDAADMPRVIAHVAPSGSGKTVLLAKSVVYLIRTKRAIVVRLSPEEVSQPAQIAKGLGLDYVSDRGLWEAIRITAQRIGRPIVVIVDALESMENASGRIAAAVQNIQALSNLSTVYITCQPVFWAEQNLSRRLLDTRYVEAVSNTRRTVAVLRRNPFVDALFRRIPDLERPVFLEALRELVATDASLEEINTVSDLLRALFAAWKLESPPPNHNVMELDTRSFLGTLGRLQRRNGTFRVSEQDLRSEFAGESLDQFLDSPPVRRIVIRSNGSVRLRHEIYNAYNVVTTAFKDASPEPQTGAFGSDLPRHEWFARQSSLPVMNMLTRVAFDRGHEPTLGWLFTEYLFALDNKRYRQKQEGTDNYPYQPASWNITYSLNSCLLLWCDRLLDFFDWDLVQLKPGDHFEPRTVSSCESRKRSQAATSTIASAFRGYLPTELGHKKDEITSRFVACLDLKRNGLWARFVEGLNRVDTLQARAAVQELMRKVLDGTEKDLKLLRYAVDGLSTEDAAGLEAIQEVATLSDDRLSFLADGLPERIFILRGAKRVAIHRLRQERGQDIPEMGYDDSDFVFDLAEIASENPEWYSDWHTVDRALRDLNREIIKGRKITPMLATAVRSTLRHTMDAVRLAGTETLFAISTAPQASPAMRMFTCEALLREYLERQVSNNLRSSLEDALHRSLPLLSDADASCFGMAMEPAIRMAEEHLDDARREMVRSWMPGRPAEGRILCALRPDLPSFEFVDEMPSLDADVLAWMDTYAHVVDEAELERKVRLVEWSRTDAGTVHLVFAKTTWQLARSFQRAVDRHFREPGTYQSLVQWEGDIAMGKGIVPGLGVTHNLVITRDHHIVFGQRSTHNAFAPGCWAASFEEQIRAEDLEHSNGPGETVLRGLREEFGLDTGEISGDNVKLLGLILEKPSLNIAACMAVRIPQTLAELREIWQRHAACQEIPELDAIDGVPMGASIALWERAASAYDFHPTTFLRLELLRRASF